MIDRDGIRKAKGNVNVRRTDLWESLGPQFAAIRQLESYQLGLQAIDVRAWRLPFKVSTEADARHEESGVAFDHALVRASWTFLEDNPDRVRVYRNEGFETDFHLRLTLRGSYYNLEELEQPWGWGVHVDALSIGAGPVEMRFGIGAGYNYYEYLIKLPIPNSGNFQFIFGLGV